MVLRVSKKENGAHEIFYSIQGEGINIGFPAVFLRLALCNLRCVWCDSRYTWDWQQFNLADNSLEMPIAAIHREILKHDCRYLVVTGGEPLLQQSELFPLLTELKTAEFYIDIETNGTIRPDARLMETVAHWSVSPKLASSGNSALLREIPECYRLFSASPSSHFKFVIQSSDDIDEVIHLARKYAIPREKIILMPQGSNKEQLLEKSDWVIGLCQKYGYRFSTRLQTIIWNNKRGL